MASLKCILGVVVLLSASVWAESADSGPDFGADKEKELFLQDAESGEKGPENHLNLNEDLNKPENDLNQSEENFSDSEEDDDNLSVSERLELTNKNLERDGDSLLEDGDIAVPGSHVHKRNAALCARGGCKWPRARNGKVYVPYVIAPHYSSSQINRIHEAFWSFAASTCINFIPRSSQRDYLYIHSSDGCWSYIGRTGNLQRLSLKSSGCIYLGTIQHELLHALGFNHEHKRSDRDHYIKVHWGNIVGGMEHNFQKVQTLNLGTPYDYGSVMHYRSTAFSKNGRPTLEAHNRRSTFGLATRMSYYDIKRVNRLYCRTTTKYCN